MNGFWDHKTKPSTFVVADKGKEIYRGPFQEGYRIMYEQKHLSILDKQIEEQFGKIIKKFPILHHGWDGDGYGYIVTDGQENKIILTNHSKPYEAKSDELFSKMDYYKHIIEETNEALKVLDE